jgi:hypothetical protein
MLFLHCHRLAFLTLLILFLQPSDVRPYTIPLPVQLKFSQDGHALLPKLLKPSHVTELLSSAKDHCSKNWLGMWQQKVSVIHSLPMSTVAHEYKTIEDCVEALSDTAIPFLQSFNLHRTCPTFSRLATSPTLAALACKLLSTSSVRLYQDTLFLKRKGDHETKWHTDCKMAPFFTNNLITFWVPLTPIAKEGGLLYADTSHRDCALHYWIDRSKVDKLDLTGRYVESDHGCIELGDVSAHHGWTLHYGNPNLTTEDRYAYSVTYVDADATIRDTFGMKKDRGDAEDEESYKDWIGVIERGTSFGDNSFMPIVPTSDQGKVDADMFQ